MLLVIACFDGARSNFLQDSPQARPCGLGRDMAQASAPPTSKSNKARLNLPLS